MVRTAPTVLAETAFLDIKASSPTGFPVELAWCAADLSAAGSWLVAPDAWISGDSLPNRQTWDPDAERVHGLTLQRLRADGSPPATVAGMLRDALAPYHAVLSENPDLDERKLTWLFVAAHSDRIPHLASLGEVPELAAADDRDKASRQGAARAVAKVIGLCDHHALCTAIREAIRLAVTLGAAPDAVAVRARALLLHHGRPEIRARLVTEDADAFVERYRPVFETLRNR